MNFGPIWTFLSSYRVYVTGWHFRARAEVEGQIEFKKNFPRWSDHFIFGCSRSNDNYVIQQRLIEKEGQKQNVFPHYDDK